MGSTTINALPYPELTDTADVPRDVKALADKIDGLLQPKIVTGLPGSPVDGQEIYYVADATKGIVWHLRYRAASASAYKWELVGGQGLRDFIATAESAPIGVANVYSDLTTPGPSVTPPLAGEYDIAIEATIITPGAAVRGYMSFANGASTAVDADMIVFGGVASSSASVGRTIRARAIAAGALVRAKYRTDSATLSAIGNRALVVTPVRVG